MPFRAAIFELSGTLVDDVAFHEEAWKRLAAKMGVPMSESVFHSFNGMKEVDVFARLLGRELGPSLLDALASEKGEHYRALAGTRIAPIAGATELLTRLRARGVRVAVVSSATAQDRAMELEHLGWNGVFDAIVTADDMPGKPAPDLFRAASAALGDVPASCLAFENTWNGAKAASSAGVTVVGLTTNVEAEVLRRGGATRTIPDYTSLPDDLDAWLSVPH